MVPNINRESIKIRHAENKNGALFSRVQASSRVADARTERCAGELLIYDLQLYDTRKKLCPMKLKFYWQVFQIKCVSTIIPLHINL